MKHLVPLVIALWVAVAASAGPPASPTESQLEAVRGRIRALEARLAELDRSSADAREQRAALQAQLELAQARVEESTVLLRRTRDDAMRLRQVVSDLSSDLEQRRGLLSRYLEMAALLGRPGPLQLFYDALRGGDLERAVDTVAVLTAGQVRLMEEYARIQKERTARLAELSLTLEDAQRESERLAAHERELENVRQSVEARLAALKRSRSSTQRQLDDLRARASALERLLGVLAQRERLTGHDDIRRYRGALPWPAAGSLVERFGRHYLRHYSTYTVCNGVRLGVASGAPVTAVFPGVVAYAQHFKGYGNMVVLDHGHDVYSLVAGLATILVRRDQRVEMGARLGLAPPPDDDGNLYFEIRVGGTAEDPLRWLRLKEAAP